MLGNLFVDASGQQILFHLLNAGPTIDRRQRDRLYGNNATEVTRSRDRAVNATGQYYIDQALGGRHELKFGTDYSHAVTRNQTHRVDDVALTYTSAGGGFTPQNVTLYATPQNDATALNVLALFAQDSFSVKRLTVVAGLRFEQIEGYLPEQSSPASRFAAANIGGFAAQPRSYDEQRNIVKWNTAGPRASAIFDLTGDGKTALKGGAGRYYYVLSTGGGGVSNVNQPNYSENVGRPERQSQVRARRTDRPAGRHRGRRQRRDSHLDRSRLQPAVHRRVQRRRRSRADGELQAQCGGHLSAREKHAGDDQS